MTKNIPYSFNKMAPYRASSDINNKLIWYMDFSDGYYQPYSKITGASSNDLVFSIETDQQVGTYLQCKSSTGDNYNVNWSGSMNYLNNLISGSAPFSVSFWLRAPAWDEYSNQIVLCWKSLQESPGLVLYGDGNAPSKIDARLDGTHNLFSNTNVKNEDWIHWAFIRDDQGARWYANGVLDASDSSYSSYDNTASRDLCIGYCNTWTCNALFDITKIRIYNRAIEDTEVNSLYTNKQ